MGEDEKILKEIIEMNKLLIKKRWKIMSYYKIILVCILFIAFFIYENIQKSILRERADKYDSAMKGWRQAIELNDELIESENKIYRELQAKYNNVERELKARDKQYLELLERNNKQ